MAGCKTASGWGTTSQAVEAYSAERAKQRSHPISPIPEGIALLDAERIAREGEPGDGSVQKWVIEQIEVALA